MLQHAIKELKPLRSWFCLHLKKKIYSKAWSASIQRLPSLR